MSDGGATIPTAAI